MMFQRLEIAGLAADLGYLTGMEGLILAHRVLGQVGIANNNGLPAVVSTTFGTMCIA